MNDEERDELGQICRRAYQKVGISSPHSSWDEIGDARREPHRKAAEDIWTDINLWLQCKVGQWGNETFPLSTTQTILAHLRDEIEEVEDAIAGDGGTDPNVEAADCFLLLLHLAHRLGFGLVPAALRKHKINTDRVWAIQMNDRGYFGHTEDGN